MMLKDLIVLIGCPNLEKDLSGLGFDVQHFPAVSVDSLVKKVNLPRAIILDERAFQKAESTLNPQEEEYVIKLRQHWPIVDIIFWSPHCSAKLALKMIKAGVREIVLENDNQTLIAALKKMLENQKIIPRVVSRGSRIQKTSVFEGIVSREQKMWDIFEDVKLVAPTSASVLILGETGTGKELIARAIHRLSQRKGRFVAVNCAAIPENLIDSELFGHIKGAFTGAHAEKKGLFRYAEGGTIFLDEIGNMPMTSQHHLLRVLQENCIRPVGAHAEIPINVRVIAATGTALEEFVERGLFREDLLYRLDVVRLVIPPLRSRGGDIVFLFSHFAQKFSKLYKRDFPVLSDVFLDELNRYTWPGNVRQLANIVERLLLTHPGVKLNVTHLRDALKPFSSEENKVKPDLLIKKETIADINTEKSFTDAVKPILERLEQSYYAKLLASNNGRIGRSAEVAGISRRTLLRKMKSWGMDKQEFKSGP